MLQRSASSSQNLSSRDKTTGAIDLNEVELPINVDDRQRQVHAVDESSLPKPSDITDGAARQESQAAWTDVSSRDVVLSFVFYAVMVIAIYYNVYLQGNNRVAKV